MSQQSPACPQTPDSGKLTAPLIVPRSPTKCEQQLTEKQEDCSRTHLSAAIAEARSIARIAIPMALTGILFFSRSMVSMLFLSGLGQLPLAGGSLAIGFANITGYSVLSGLAMGMEPICGQAFGAKRYKLLGLTLHRTVNLLLLASLPISFLWANMREIMILCGQDEGIAAEARTYMLYSIPDLLANAFLHPLRIYLRAQSITMPLTYCAALALLLHVPINYLLVSVLQLGTKGVALGGVWFNFNMVGSLIAYVIVSEKTSNTWCAVSRESFKEWRTLVNLAIPSCVSVCLEWWWYEIMILLCGLLANPTETVASMGILIQTTSLIYIFPSSLSLGVSTRVGNELGASNPQRAKLAATVGIYCSFVLGIAALAFSVTVRGMWARLFTEDAEIIALTSMVLPVIGLCELGNCPQTTGCGALRGAARPKVGANINLGCFYLVGMPVAVWLGFFGGLGFRGLWFGLLAAQGSCVATMMVVLGRTDWNVQADRARGITGQKAAASAADVDEVGRRQRLTRLLDDAADDDMV